MIDDDMSKYQRGSAYGEQRRSSQRRVHTRDARVDSGNGLSVFPDFSDGSASKGSESRGGRPEPEAIRRRQKLGEEEPGELSADEVIEQAERNGEQHLKELVQASRPHYTIEEMAEELGWTGSEVKDAIEDRHIHYVRDKSDEIRLPDWQLHDGGLVEGLEKVLEALPNYDWPSDLIFFETEHSLLEEETPAEALLKGRVDKVVRCAAQAWRHGAA